MAIKIPQVQERGLPTTTGVKTPNADAFGAGVGEAIGGLGNALGDIGLQLQNQENKTKARESDTYFTQKVNNLKQAYLQQNGQVAYESNPDYEKALADIRREAEDMLDNDAQRAEVAPLFDRKINAAQYDGKAHSIKSMQQWQESSIQGQMTTHTETAVGSYGTPDGDLALQALYENIEDMGFEKGLAPEQIEAQKVQATSTVTSSVIQKRLESDPYGAMQLYQDSVQSGALSPTDAAKLGPRVEAHYSDWAIRDTARTIIQSGALPEEMMSMAKDISDDEEREKVESRIREHVRFQATLDRETQRKVTEMEYDRIVELGPNAKLDDIKPAQEIGVQAHKSLTAMVEQQQKTGRTIETNQVYQQNELNKFYENPTEYRKNFNRADHAKWMSPADLNTFQKTIQGKAGTKTAAGEMRKRLFGAAGISGSGRAPQAKRAQLGAMFDNEISRQTAQKGKDLTSPEQDKIMHDVIFQYKTEGAPIEIEIDGSGFFSDDVYDMNAIKQRQADPSTAIKNGEGVPYAMQDIEAAVYALTRKHHTNELTDSEIKKHLKKYER
jgi:hypothetical protein